MDWNATRNLSCSILDDPYKGENVKGLRTPRSVSIVLGLALLALALPMAALAAGFHFNSASAALSGPNLVVSFVEAGLGNNQNIDYAATANATAVYACYNNGGKNPKATNKETVSGPVGATGSFSSGKNGSISASLTITPPSAGSFSCPSGQSLFLDSVTYTNVVITDTTNNVSEPIPGSFTYVRPGS